MPILESSSYLRGPKSKSFDAFHPRKSKSGGESFFNPLDLSPKIFLRADQGTSIDSGSVDNWASLDETGFVFSSTGTDRPSFTENAFGFRPGITFTTDDFLLVNSNIVTFTQGDVFILYSPTNTSGEQTFLGTANTTVDTRYLSFGSSDASTDTAVFRQRNNDTEDLLSMGGTISANNKQILHWRQEASLSLVANKNNSSETVHVDGGANNGDWFGDVSSRNVFTLGCVKTNSGNSEFMEGHIGVIFVSGLSLSAANVTNVYNWIAAWANHDIS